MAETDVIDIGAVAGEVFVSVLPQALRKGKATMVASATTRR
jgi:hypothetical protein